MCCVCYGDSNVVTTHRSYFGDQYPENTRWAALLERQDIMDGYERQVIFQALEYYGGSITAAAQALGLQRQSLQYRIRKYGIIF